MQPYSTSLEHVLDELARVSLLLQIQASTEPPGGGGAAAGSPSRDADEEGQSPEELRRVLGEVGREIEVRVQASALAGVPLRLFTLAQRFDLPRTDLDVLLLTLLPEAGGEFESVYAELQGSPARRWPCVDLLLGLSGESIEERARGRARFTHGAPLIRHGLVRLIAESPELQPCLPGHLVRVDPRIAGYLLDSDEIDSAIRSHARVVVPRADLSELFLPVEIRERLGRFAREAIGASGPPPAMVYLQGPRGAGKRTTAEALCRELGMKLLVVDGAALGGGGEEPLKSLSRRFGREAVLQGAAVYWDGAEALLRDDNPALRAAFLDALDACPGLVFLSGKEPWEPGCELSSRGFVRVEMPRPSAAEQARLWRAALADPPGLSADVDLDALTSAFRLSGGQIRDAAAAARNLARFRAASEPVTRTDLQTAARLHSSLKLTSMGRRVSPRATWNELVLPHDRKERLAEICTHLRHRARVMDAWGFDRKLALGKGISALFAGPPGTGKTLAAGVMANELGLDLYQVDLSAVLSKYIGETEQHLSQLFDEAESSNAILFFDEADTLFGKRTEVRDAHDRNANLQASYMLQRIEAYEGIAILASNFTKNLDSAFVRRLRFIVEFPFPGEAERRLIWEQAFPAAAPLAADVDHDFLACKIELAGGGIRNIALRAAFLAASRGDVVGMKHILRAALWEYQKMGKVLESSHFAHPAATEGEAW